MKKIILITGCSSGLGKCLAELLSEGGHVVYAGIRNDQERKKLSASWKNQLNLHPIKLDITNDKECAEIISQIIKEQKRLDVLINNAGYTLSGPIENFSSTDFSNLLNTNVIGTFRLIKEVLPFMKQKKSGHIINITSLNGLVALPHFSLYCASKFALEGLTRSLISEVNSFNIKITNIEPGAMKGEVSPDKEKKLSHKPAREKFAILRILMPIVTIQSVAKKISDIIDNQNPPTSVLIGNDAKITTYLQRFLPNFLWNKLVAYISHG